MGIASATTRHDGLSNPLLPTQVTEWLELAFNESVAPKAVMLNIDCPGACNAPGGRHSCHANRSYHTSCYPDAICAETPASSSVACMFLHCCAVPLIRLPPSLHNSVSRCHSTSYQGLPWPAGGQPGATEMIYSAIRRAADDSKIPVIACAQNLAASGG
jgi:hypothetical protein